ncbi:MAG: asparagine synthase (glutamine-hydrolyzing) [Desulfobacter sp.]|nr:MAG: asparagine synthase (glutamine-hydrolyzing) [Desulfobacter sp.]
MCGIAGFCGVFEFDLLDRMNRVQSHRGPDDHGTWFDDNENIGLAHRRLSIIDLSAKGHQPMVDDNTVIVFNGEIYNYKDLRVELEGHGCFFKSNSDTEVLLKLYEHFGHKMLEKLNGIFAFAIWDKRKKELFLARDHVGVKPLYYSLTSHGFLFASEMKSLLQYKGLDRTVNIKAIHYYLTYLWCPSPNTMLRSVAKLEPGYAMVVKNKKIITKWQYYDLPYNAKPMEIDKEEAIAQVRKQVETSVARQLVADVPVGAFLSGGLDSSAVVAMASRHCSDLECFTIGFKDNVLQREGFVEDLPYAKHVAKHLGVKLNTVYVGPEMSAKLTDMLWHLDEPQADPAPLNVLFISELAREQGINVLLSGAGGDDIFTGYRRHFACLQERYWSWLPKNVQNKLRICSKRISQDRAWGRRLSKGFRFAGFNKHERLAGYFHWLDVDVQWKLYSQETKCTLKHEPFSAPLIQSLNRLDEEVHDLNRMLYLEGKHFLADHNLNYTDKMGMAKGVEVRVPLLDPELVDLACRLPVRYKQHGREGKWIFKKAMEPLLPHNIVYRPKTGFGAPLRRWLKSDLRHLVEEILSHESLTRRGVFDPTGVQDLLELDQAGKIDATYPIFSMMCIELWCRIFLD